MRPNKKTWEERAVLKETIAACTSVPDGALPSAGAPETAENVEWFGRIYILFWLGNPAGKQYNRDIRFCIYFFSGQLMSVDFRWSEWNMDLLYVYRIYRLGKSWRLHYVRQPGNERNRRKSWLYRTRNCLDEPLLVGILEHFAFKRPCSSEIIGWASIGQSRFALARESETYAMDTYCNCCDQTDQT